MSVKSRDISANLNIYTENIYVSAKNGQKPEINQLNIRK